LRGVSSNRALARTTAFGTYFVTVGFIIAGLAAAGLLTAGCGDDELGENVVAKKIGADGGTITSFDGVLTLSFVPGALEYTAEIQIAPSETPPSVYGPAYRVKPNIELASNIDVSYRDERRLPEDGLAYVGAIRLSDYESGAGYWRALPRTELDEEYQLVTGTDTEISLFYSLLGGSDVAGGTGPDEGESDTGDPTEDTGTEPETGTPAGISHAEMIQPIWTANCAVPSCHVPGFYPPLLEDDAYPNIVEQRAALASFDLVTPGSAEMSYLYHKIAGTATIEGVCGCNGSGVTMPANADPLPVETINLVRDWIDQGAQE